VTIDKNNNKYLELTDNFLNDNKYETANWPKMAGIYTNCPKFVMNDRLNT